MNKEIILTITGLQEELKEDEALEVLIPGEYYNRDGKHYILYEELSEDDGAVTKSVLKASPEKVELTRRGERNVAMVFEAGKTSNSIYTLPYGSLDMAIHTTDIHINETDTSLDIEVFYSLDINYEHISDCVVRIIARNRQ